VREGMGYPRSYNPIPLPASPLKGEELRKFPPEKEGE